MIRTIILFSLIVFFKTTISYGQTQKIDTIQFAGKRMARIITEKGDTVFLDQLDPVTIYNYKFGSHEEYELYLKYKRYAAIVYPYALEAMRIYGETKYVTASMSRRNQKRYLNQLQKDLKLQFDEPLKKLTKTQGKILTKMLEKEMNMTFYDFIKDIKGGWTAFYYNTSGLFYGYKLKDGYIVGEDKIMDLVLNEYRLSIKSRD